MMKHLHREDEAMEALIDGYTKIIGSDQVSFSNRVLFASEITVLAVKLWGECVSHRDVISLF